MQSFKQLLLNGKTAMLSACTQEGHTFSKRWRVRHRTDRLSYIDEFR